jgi:hygromycin-B 7''-O-kinase
MAVSLFTRLSGVLGADAWPSLPEQDKERVLAEIGETIAEVQRAPIGALAGIEPDWGTFMRGQIEGCRARHERLGLPQKFLDGVDELLRDVAATLIALDGPPVILTGEYIPENFLLSRGASGWQLAGLIDFGDVMTGRGEYDLLGPSAFMTGGMPRRVRSLFEGFGYSAADITRDLRRRLMALMLLHRFGDPTRQISIEGWQQKAGNLHELQDLLWQV